MRRLHLVIITLIFLFSCTQLTPEEKMIKQSLGKTARIGMFESIRQGDMEISYGEFRDRYPFISLVYLEDGCLPCYPKFIEWQTRMDKVTCYAWSSGSFPCDNDPCFCDNSPC